MSVWIKCSDQEPPKYIEILLLASMKSDLNYNGDKKYHQNKQFVGVFDGADFECVYGDGWIPFSKEEVHHWMNLPPLPDQS
jgi:hypothetical protein